MTLFDAIHTIEQSHNLKTIDAALLCNLLNDYQVYANNPACHNILKHLILDSSSYKIVVEMWQTKKIYTENDINILVSQIEDRKGYASSLVYEIFADLLNFNKNVLPEYHQRSKSIFNSLPVTNLIISGVEIKGRGREIYNKLKEKGYTEKRSFTSGINHLFDWTESSNSDEEPIDETEFVLEGCFAGINKCIIELHSETLTNRLISIDVTTPRISINEFRPVIDAYYTIKKSILQKHPYFKIINEREVFYPPYKLGDGEEVKAFLSHNANYSCSLINKQAGKIFLRISVSSEKIWIKLTYILFSSSYINDIADL